MVIKALDLRLGEEVAVKMLPRGEVVSQSLGHIASWLFCWPTDEVG